MDMVRIGDIEKSIKASRASIYRWVNAGKFPEPVVIGPRTRAWRKSDIESWISSRPIGIQRRNHEEKTSGASTGQI